MKNSIWYWLPVVLLAAISCNNPTSQQQEVQAEQVEQTDPLSAFDSLNAQIEKHPTDALLYNKRANFYLAVDDRNKALADVNRALQIDTLNANIWVTLADVYFASERFVDSREILLKAVNLDPKNTAALLKLARLYFIYKDYKTAMSYLNTALEINPNLDDAYFIKGMAYAEAGDTNRAVFNYQKAVEINPSFYDAWIELGNLHAASESGLAEQYYKNAIEIDTNNTHSKYILAFYYQEHQQVEKALDMYQSILKKEENKNVYFNIGYINLVYLNNYEEAVSYFQKALNLDENYYDAMFNLAYALELSGDEEDARATYKELLQRVPNHEKALEQLNKLDQ